MKYISSPFTDPYTNLALEEYVFRTLSAADDFFMLWQNYNSVIIGRFQNTIEEIDEEYCRENGIRVARRLTGGGAVFHDRGNLNYTLITKQEQKEDFDFSIFVRPVISVLEGYGIPAEFSGRNDILIDGKKISGNSQYFSRGVLLHHGCIMLESNLADVSRALRPKEAKFESKGIKSVVSRVTTINENAPGPISMEQFKEDLKNEFLDRGGMTDYELTEQDLENVRALKDNKYATWEWNYGKSPAYNVRKEKKFPQGLVTVQMDVNEGNIVSIRFFGDFFSNKDINELENSLAGRPLSEDLLPALEQISAGEYLGGLSAAELYALLTT